jgi:predicted DNA-binding protein with PD1-like motif
LLNKIALSIFMTPHDLTSTHLICHALRLSPGEDLKHCLQAFADRHRMAAGCLLTAVGSLQQVCLRYAGQDAPAILTGRFEIVSLVGTIAQGGCHLHMAIADEQGRTLGGHVMAGCLVYTTAEIVVAALPGLTFQRLPDAQTGYRELVIYAEGDLSS